jgi:hypothetical protein
LLAARGNSGVILSQLVRGLSEVVGESATSRVVGEQGTDDLDGLDGPALARAVRRASDRAYASVTRPVEGTILTVAAAAAGAAEHAAAAGADLARVAQACLSAARSALAATTAQLPALERAGVVDAGGLVRHSATGYRPIRRTSALQRCGLRPTLAATGAATMLASSPEHRRTR